MDVILDALVVEVAAVVTPGAQAVLAAVVATMDAIAVVMDVPVAEAVTEDVILALVATVVPVAKIVPVHATLTAEQDAEQAVWRLQWHHKKKGNLQG